MYKIQGVPTKISAVSRAAIKVKDNYYTVEASEERSLPNDSIYEVKMDEEWKALFDSLNEVVDNQMQEIIDTFVKK